MNTVCSLMTGTYQKEKPEMKPRPLALLPTTTTTTIDMCWEIDRYIYSFGVFFAAHFAWTVAFRLDGPPISFLLLYLFVKSSLMKNINSKICFLSLSSLWYKIEMSCNTSLWTLWLVCTLNWHLCYVFQKPPEDLRCSLYFPCWQRFTLHSAELPLLVAFTA